MAMQTYRIVLTVSTPAPVSESEALELAVSEVQRMIAEKKADFPVIRKAFGAMSPSAHATSLRDAP